MNVLQGADRSAAAFSLLAAVDVYSVAFDGLLQSCSSASYAEVRETFQKVRAVAPSLPEAAVALASLVISQAELLSEPWAAQSGPLHAKSRAAVQRHSNAIAHLRRCCLQLLSGV